jgi:enoyl-CoA hydratase/carnithine racemase
MRNELIMENNQVLKLTIQDNAVAIIELQRPEARNALNLELRQALSTTFQELSKNENVRAIVLTGGEKVFAAGADIKDFTTATTSEMYLRHTEQYWQSIVDCPKPIIAAVNGYALGGGCELAMHADIIIAGSNAKFGQPEVKLGLMPGAGGTQRLLRAIGKFQTMLMVLTGKMIEAAEAKQMGLVSEVVESEQTIAHALEIAANIAALSPIAVQQIKEVTNLGQDMSLQSALTLERKAFQLLFDTQDQKEGVNAFFEKRPANYQGK